MRYLISLFTFFALVFCVPVFIHADVEDDLAEEMTEQHHPAPPRSVASTPNESEPAPVASPQDFSVATIKLNHKTAPAKDIQLITPIHRATYTTGMLTFSWKPKKKLKKTPKYTLIVESVDGTKKITKKLSHEQKDLALDIGEYKWQVSTEKGLESPWRHFKIVDMNGRSTIRDPSSKENEDEDDNSANVAEEEGGDEPKPAPKSHLPALSPPKWVRHHG